jgi:hypothetical protein
MFTARNSFEVSSLARLRGAPVSVTVKGNFPADVAHATPVGYNDTSGAPRGQSANWQGRCLGNTSPKVSGNRDATTRFEGSSMNEADPRVKRTRKLLRDAFVALLAERRFHRISVQDIAERATVNRASFYAPFVDKCELLDDVLARGSAKR